MSMKLVSARKVEATLTDEQLKSVLENSFFQALKLRPADLELSNGSLTIYIGHNLVSRSAEPFIWNDEQQSIWLKALDDLGVPVVGLDGFEIRPDTVALRFAIDKRWT